MTPKRMRNNSRFFLKVRSGAALDFANRPSAVSAHGRNFEARRASNLQGTFLKQTGTRDTGEGETHPAAETTRWLSEAQGFQTRRQAERMRDLLYDRYGIKTDIIRYDGGRRYEA